MNSDNGENLHVLVRMKENSNTVVKVSVCLCGEGYRFNPREIVSSATLDKLTIINIYQTNCNNPVCFERYGSIDQHTAILTVWGQTMLKSEYHASSQSRSLSKMRDLPNKRLLSTPFLTIVEDIGSPTY